jgi:hypothetical protein
MGYRTEEEILQDMEDIRDVVKGLEAVRQKELAPSVGNLSPTISATPAAGLSPSACVLCAKDLSSMRGVDIFEHRLPCFSAHNPQQCPVCKMSFENQPIHPTDPPYWRRREMVFHLYACQHGGSLTPVQTDDYEALIAAWRGQLENAGRIHSGTIGPRKTWGHRQHRRSVTTKKDFGIKEEGWLYLIEVSPLRTVQMVLPARPFKSDTEVETTTFEKTKLPDYVPMDKFRRSSYAVISLPQGEEPSEGYKTDEVVRETISVVDPKAFWASFALHQRCQRDHLLLYRFFRQRRRCQSMAQRLRTSPLPITWRPASSRYIATFQRGQSYSDNLQAYLYRTKA